MHTKIFTTLFVLATSVLVAANPTDAFSSALQRRDALPEPGVKHWIKSKFNGKNHEEQVAAVEKREAFPEPEAEPEDAYSEYKKYHKENKPIKPKRDVAPVQPVEASAEGVVASATATTTATQTHGHKKLVHSAKFKVAHLEAKAGKHHHHEQIVKRSKIGDKIKHAFQKIGHVLKKAVSIIF